ncbi:MAG: Rieske 2Fe-2S domain-containing protein [Anaerolineaceae bacterium]|nr:Rieske 2Fe-2S domain-containing protein [Anaerolineaceae bacterium]
MATASAAQAAPVGVDAPSRREFLYYIWGASIALLLGEAAAGLIWFALPRFKEGEFGGVFNVEGDLVPAANKVPVSMPAGRFWLSNVEGRGLYVLYGVCTHLGCLPKWVETNNRFECPCHGSKYERTGKYIEGPAPRSLDKFEATVTFDDGTSVTSGADGVPPGGPLPIEGHTITNVAVNTGDRYKSTSRLDE